MAKKVLSELYQLRIEQIVATLKGSVKQIHIRNWLENFFEYEWDKALTVLEKLKYFSLTDTIAEYDNLLNKLIRTLLTGKTLFISSSSEYGKSGSTMIYMLRKTPAFQANSSRISILSHIDKLRQQGFKNGDTLVLVDDFIGSGESWSRFYFTHLSKQVIKDKLELQLVFMTIAYLRESIDSLRESIKREFIVLGAPYPKVFTSSGSPFGYRPKMLPIRNFCYKYADRNKLFVTHDYKTGTDVSHPLGFRNSQALIVFEHSVPNNTLPIIWSTKNQWIPLFARSGKDRIVQSKEAKNESRYWVSMARKLEIIDFSREDGGSVYSNINYRMFAMLKLKKQGVIDPKIFQLLGLGSREYQEIIEEGLKKGIFTSEGEVTEKGEEAYRQIARNVKSLSKLKQNMRNFDNLEKIDNYVPKKFLGKA